VSSTNAVPSAEQTETVGKEVEMNVTIQMVFTTEYTYEQLSSKTEPVMMGNKLVPEYWSADTQTVAYMTARQI